MSLPLSGIRIIDLGLYVAGPYASVPLGDFGADIIKIEPLGGEPNRTIWRAFACCNRGKRVISLDLKSPEGLQIAMDLCGKADVVHHNFRPGVVDRIGLGYGALSKTNPGLVFLESSAYGHSGPMVKQPGFDMMVQALCGHEARGAGEGNTPMWLRWAPVDFTGGYLGAIAILAALYRRMHENKGGVVRVNLLDGGNYILSELLRNADGSFSGVEPLNSEQTGSHPARSIYATSDGWVAVVARSPRQSVALAECLKLKELAKVPDASWGEQARQSLAERMETMSTQQVVQRLRERGVWVEPCRRDFQDILFTDKVWQEAGFIRESAHPRNENIRQLGNMMRLSDTPYSSDSGGMVAEPGEHTREILEELGHTASQIDSWYERKIVG